MSDSPVVRSVEPVSASEEGFLDRCRDLLMSQWANCLDNDAYASDSVLHEEVLEIIENGGKTYPYMLVTQVLGKVVDVNINATVMQKGSNLEGAWDARTLASKVVCQWNIFADSPMKGSGIDPYVSNPGRIPHFSAEAETKAKRVVHYRLLEKVCRAVQGDSSLAMPVLIDILYVFKKILANRVGPYYGPQRVSLNEIMGAVDKFLSTRSGGERLQLVCFTVIKCFICGLNPNVEIETQSVNTSDTSSGRSGDISIDMSGVNLLTVEVKDRSVSSDDVESTLLKARSDKISNILFLVRATKQIVDEDVVIDRISREFTRGIDVNISEAMSFIRFILMIMSPTERSGFMRSIFENIKTFKLPYKAESDWQFIVRQI